MIFRNFGAALRASGVPILIAIAISFGVSSLVGLRAAAIAVVAVDPQRMATLIQSGSTPQLVGVLFLMLVYAFVFAWICVTWHRFILLEERPGPVPAITGRPIWLYVGTTMLLAVLLILLAIPLTFVLSYALAPLVGEAPEQGGTVVRGIGLLVDAVLSYLWFRFAVVLPAAAIGKPMTLGDGWTATGRAALPILGAVLILMGLTVLSGYGIGWLRDVSLWAAVAGALVVQWVTLMMGASVLTTIYGVTVERRALG